MNASDRANGHVTIRIDLASIRHNLARARARSKSRVLAVIRADAFGHGAREILPALSDAGALGVSSVSEAIALRAGGERRDIVVLHGFKSIAEIADCTKHSLTPVVHNRDQIEMLQGQNHPHLKCWAQFDTGCGWLGLRSSQAAQVHRKLNAAGVKVECIMIRLESAHRSNDISTDRQLRIFRSLRWNASVHRSAANSAALLTRVDSHFDWVRPGLMLYGASPFDATHDMTTKSNADDEAASSDRWFGLQPAMRVTAPVVAIRDFQTGERIGGTGVEPLRRPTTVAFVRVGYADGYPRVPVGKGSVMLGNRRCAILGEVTMELLAVDVTSLTVPPPIDFPVTLWGHAQLRVDDVARLAGVDPRELLCRIRGTQTWSDAPTGVNVRDFSQHREA